ncbi:MAG: hypothetical protein CL920_28835 [Deltaproteobacteria bacterium]|nr:hypothetical protein [Deltaproteobacteria bacterium]
MSQATSSTYSIARTTYAVVICFMHFATTPSTNLSIPLSLPALSPSSPSSGRGKGSIQTTCTGVGACEREKTSLSLPCGRQIPLLFNFVGKGSDARPPQTGFARQLPLCDLRFASVDKGSDAYQTIYRNANETSVYIG